MTNVKPKRPPTLQKAFRLPVDIAEELERRGNGNATDYVVEALREKFKADERERFRRSFERLADLPSEATDMEWAMPAQSEVVQRD
ncbi:hypothetical protein EON79_05235 [bacterium]|nr:MAG: hypothetical protein EON79_05235 [bacterium]